jgi:predicted transglutaminase-like cysteine proteinase
MSAINRRAAPRLVTTVLAIAVLASACGSATANSRKPRGVDRSTGYGELIRIAPPPLSDAAAAPAVAPARFFTINKMLAKLDGKRDELPSDQVRLAARQDSVTDAPGALPRMSGPEPFGMFAFRAPEGVLWSKWRGVAADIAREAETIAQCRASVAPCSPAATRFIAVIDEARTHDGRGRLEAVNRAVNDAIRYTSDMEQHGVADLWSAPLASFAAGRGDCEDYAIAKYVALRDSGVAAEDMRILLVRDLAVREDHAVLAVRHAGRWMVLDNRRMALSEDSELRNLMPLFAIDQEGVKLFAAPYVERDPDGRAGISPAAADWGVASSGGGGTLPLVM